MPMRIGQEHSRPPTRPRSASKVYETSMMASWTRASNRRRLGPKREMGLGESEAGIWVMSSHYLIASLSGTTTKSGDGAYAFDLIRAALPRE